MIGDERGIQEVHNAALADSNPGAAKMLNSVVDEYHYGKTGDLSMK